MPINFAQVLVNYDNVELTEDILTPDGKPLRVKATLGRICRNVLGAGQVQGESPMTGDEPVRRWQLGLKLANDPTIDLAAEEIALIKARILKGYDKAIVIGQAICMIDPASGQSVVPMGDDEKAKKKAA